MGIGGGDREEDLLLGEVSCRNTGPILQWLRAQDVEADRVLAELGVDVAELEEPGRFISWSDFNRLLAPFEARLGDEDFRRLGAELLDAPMFGLIGVVASNATSVGWLAGWVMRLTCGPSGLLYRGVEQEVRSLSASHLRVVIRALPGRRLPRPMALAFAGSLQRMAALLGDPRARVDVSWTPERFELDLHSGRPWGLGARLGRLWSRLRPGGPAREVQLAYERLMEVNGELEERIAALRRSERRRRELERRLGQAQRMEAIGRFAGAIAHDFNNLLTVLSAHGEFAALALESGRDARPSVRAIRETVEQASALTRQLLTFGRREPADARPLDLNQVIESLAAMLSTLVGERVRLELDLDPDVEPVRADRAQLEQVLANLCANARDAMPRGGAVRIRTRTRLVDEDLVSAQPGAVAGPHTVLSVSDDGEGMTREVRDRAFEPFFTTKAEGQGTGLGLATVYGIVQQWGGWVWLYSEPGQGTTFTIHLPCARPEAAALPEPEEPGLEAPDEPPGRVLVVEDDRKVRVATARALEGAGHRLWVAASAARGLELFEAHADEIELVVSDMVMPGMSGEELMRAVRRRSPEVGLLLVSGYADDGPARAGRLAEVDRFLQKPFSPAVLQRAVRELLAEVRRRRGAAGS